MEEKKGNMNGTSSTGIRASKPPRPTLTLPPRNSTEAFLKGVDAATPSPMTFVASLFSDHDPYEGGDSKSFSQLLAGAIASSPTALSDSNKATSAASASASVAAPALPPQEETAPNTNSAKFKSKMPPKIPIPRSPYITIPPGLSPTMLLQSPVLLPSAQAEPSPTTGTFVFPPLLQEAAVPSKSSQDGSFVFKSPPKLPDSPLANMGPFGVSHQEALAHVQAQALSHSSQEDPTALVRTSTVESMDIVPSALTPSRSPSPDPEQALEPTVEPSEKSHVVARAHPLPHLIEKPSEDGFNWRKYGQKQVKGSEYPRSYYKCTHPSCPVRKKVERSYDGQITEIIYKGDHNHPKPPPTRRTGMNNAHSSDVHVREDSQTDKTANYRSSADSITRLQSGVGISEPSLGSISDDDTEGAGEEDSDSKRRRFDKIMEPMGNPPLRTVREPRVVVQTTSEVDILDDGYRWRKYGQKVVKGNPHPRSYYRCTNAGCMVRKHVERSSTDPKAVITTYEGKHNHDVPTGRNSNYEPTGRSMTSVKVTADSTLSGTIVNVSKPGAISLQDQLFGRMLENRYESVSKIEVGASSQPLLMGPNMSGMRQSDEYFGEALALRPKEEPCEGHSGAEPKS